LLEIRFTLEWLHLDGAPESMQRKARLHHRFDDLRQFMTRLLDWFKSPRQKAADCCQKGRQALDDNDFDLAISWFNACVGHDPRHDTGFVGRGFAHLKKGDYDRAIADLSEAIRLGPDNPYSYYYRSLCYSGKGHQTLEGIDLQKAVRLGAEIEHASGAEGTGRQDEVFMALRAALREMSLHDLDAPIGALAAGSITQLDAVAPAHISSLLASLRHHESTIRFGAAHTLGDLGEAARPALASIKHALVDRDLGVRVQAARALWLIDRQTAGTIPILSEALMAQDEVLRWMAADCLGDMGPRAAAAASALEKALEANFEIAHVRTGLTVALERIRGKVASH
jgi:tetratricopeptide (TPR) repeat protein